MKFRHKVLMFNIILLSFAIGIVGFFMIRQNFKVSLDNQIHNAIEENNLIQAVVEYNLLSSFATSYENIEDSLENIGKDVSNNTAVSQSSLFITYDDVLLYSYSPDNLFYSNELINQINASEKGYTLTSENGKYYITVSSANSFNDKKLCIITKRDISESYSLIKKQSSYFRFLLAVVLFVCSISMLIISVLLTKPLEQLTKISESFGEGHYSVRAYVNSEDEIGELAKTYNEMASAVERHVDMLEESVKRKEQFVADFTHEMKTPMTSIIGYADTIRSRELNRENQIMAASYIVSEGKRLEAMSRKLFDLLGTTNSKITMTDIDTDYLVESIISSVKPSYDAKSLTLVSSNESAVISGDIELIKSAFINILDNAKKASEKGSKIMLTGKVENDSYLLSVRDYGIGIAKEHLDKVCDEFYMVDKSRSRKEGGAGLGLSLVNQIATVHNAKLSIESTLGEGTTVTIQFALRGDSDEE